MTAIEPHRGTRAVILGGGGVTGIAWEIGVLAGLRGAGIDLHQVADALFGTSAGAFAATLIARNADIEERYAAQFQPDPFEVPAAMPPHIIALYEDAIQAHYGEATALARAYGQIARNATTIGTEVRRTVVEQRLGSAHWPDDKLHFASIDADSGELVVLDRSSGLSLAEAAMASGAVPGLWPLVRAGGREWIDGGMISAANVHLGSGFERVLVIAPVSESTTGFDSVEEAANRLRHDGAVVLVITPDEPTAEAIGPNLFDPSRRGVAAKEGRRQANVHADEVRLVWAA
jgi:NTE family protein